MRRPAAAIAFVLASALVAPARSEDGTAEPGPIELQTVSLPGDPSELQ